MKELKGKCKKYIKENLCFGCNRLEMKNFEGDDNCIYIKEREMYEENYKNWRINK